MPWVGGGQGRLWMRHAGLTVMPSYPFGCECGQSGCRCDLDGHAGRLHGQDRFRALIAHDARADAMPAHPREG